jgi:hypothetical protein
VKTRELDIRPERYKNEIIYESIGIRLINYLCEYEYMYAYVSIVIMNFVSCVFVLLPPFSSSPSFLLPLPLLHSTSSHFFIHIHTHEHNNMLFEDTFSVTQVNPDGKKFDKGQCVDKCVERRRGEAGRCAGSGEGRRKHSENTCTVSIHACISVPSLHT